MRKNSLLLGLLFSFVHLFSSSERPCVYYWIPKNFINFGDYLSLKLFERITGNRVEVCPSTAHSKRKLLGIGSIIAQARDNDIIWGSGVNGKSLDRELYRFTNLDARAVRGPLTRDFLIKNFNINCPEVYGDPALLIPYFFPEFKKSKNPKYEYIIIPHYSEERLFSKDKYKNIVSTKEPWNKIIKKIVNSKLVISSSLHGVIVAEAFGIPARLLKVTNNEPLFKYDDYYYGTNRFNYKYATSVEEAIKMGGEKPFKCDLAKLYKAFPFEFWPETKFNQLKSQK